MNDEFCQDIDCELACDECCVSILDIANCEMCSCDEEEWYDYEEEEDDYFTGWNTDLYWYFNDLDPDYVPVNDYDHCGTF